MRINKIIFLILLVLLKFNSDTNKVWGQSSNNLCSGSITISQTGGCVNGSIISSDADNITGCVGCQTTPCTQHKDVWFTFVSTGTSFTYNLSGGTLINGEILLISSTGTCSGMSLVNSSCGALPLSGTFTGLTVGTTYYVVVSSPNNSTGSFTLCTTVSNPTSGGNQDCSSATQVCSNSPFAGNSNNYGSIQELNGSNQGCLSIEHQSSWYVIQIQSGGTLTMTISPSTGVDYDYAMWGPNPNCPPTTNPIRCSFASGFTTNLMTGSYNTGIGSPGTESSDGTGGTLDGWSNTMNVLTGEIYILLIDNFTANSTPFNLNWGGTATLNCSPLPIDLLYFKGSFKNNKTNFLEWSTSSETNNDYYNLYRSYDGITWDLISNIDGKGNYNGVSYYKFEDNNFKLNSINYYKLSQVDFDGNSKTFNVVVIDNNIEIPILIGTYTIYGQKIDPESCTGIVIQRYSDGSIIKIIR